MQLGKEAQYAYSDNERGQILKNLEKGKEGKSNVNIQRYKGLGEMNADQLWETTMDPVQRKMKVITINDAAGADKLFNILMGGEVEPRKQFIQMYASAVRNLDV